jgi:hypothetical protein
MVGRKTGRDSWLNSQPLNPQNPFPKTDKFLSMSLLCSFSGWERQPSEDRLRTSRSWRMSSFAGDGGFLVKNSSTCSAQAISSLDQAVCEPDTRIPSAGNACSVVPIWAAFVPRRVRESAHGSHHFARCRPVLWQRMRTQSADSELPRRKRRKVVRQ